MRQNRTTSIVLSFLISIVVITMLFSCGTKEGDTVYITSYEVPGVPTNIQAAAGDGEVTIRWSPVSGATSYNIYWNTTGIVTTSDSAIISAPSPYVHTGLTNGTTYHYAVTAVNIEGESDLSSEASVTPVESMTSNPPSAPTGVQATAADSQITISWNPVSGATSYNIYWNTSGSVTTSDSAVINAPLPYVHMNLTNGTTYYYAVTAISNDGESALSMEVSGTPQTTAFPPTAPTNVQAMGGDGQITISWSPVSGAISYNIYWNIAGSVTTLDDVIINASSPYVHMNLPSSNTFYYVVTALNANGESVLSAEVSAVPTLFSQLLQKISPSDAQAQVGFGSSVSISGDYVIVGAFRESGGPGGSLPDAGAAYIFHRTGPNTWDTGTKIVAPDAQADDWFASTVSISGDYAVVGAYKEDGGAGDPKPDAGAAYIFHRTGPNTWDTGTKIVAPDAQADDWFGLASISGDYAIVGAMFEDGGPGDPLNNAGAAYVFHRTGTNTWDSGTKIVASDTKPGDLFGETVSIDGDYAIVGASFEYRDIGNPMLDAGAAYIYHRTDTNTWDAGTKIVAPDAQAGDRFGGVSISGDYAIVGAFNEDGGAGDPLTRAGAAYIFHRTGPNTWDTGTKIVAPDAQAEDWFGLASISGDYAIVGSWWEDGGLGDPFPDAGAAYIFHRTGPNTWDTGTKKFAPVQQANDRFGCSVSISGNNIAVGAVGNALGEGAVYIY